MSSGLPLLFNASGPVPTPPATILAALLAGVASQVPDYTANLPGGLIEDISSTDVGALIVVDQARVDSINSVTPYAANPYILALLGAQFGVAQGTTANASVYLQFTGSPGYVIAPGFTCSDGTNQYVIQDGGAIAAGGTTDLLYAVAVGSGTFAIPANTVTTIVTSVPGGYTVAVTNPQAGTPAQSAETAEAYRSRLLTAYQSWGQGTPTLLKTLLKQVPGVNPRLISVIQNSTKWEVICGGGDAYDVAYAIYRAIPQLGLLTGSATTLRNVTVTIFDPPNNYSVVFVNPPQQEVTVAVTWNTTLANFTAAGAVNQFIIQGVQAYINSIAVGGPINLMVMTDMVQNAVAPVLSETNLTTLTFVVKYGGVVQNPTGGTSIIPAPDAETYLYASATDVTSVQG